MQHESIKGSQTGYMASEIMVNVYMGHVLGENALGWTKNVVTNVCFLGCGVFEHQPCQILRK